VQNSERFSALLKSKFCKELEQDLARELLNKSTLMMTTDDKEVVRQSEVLKGLYLIVSGAVYVSALTPEGDRAQLNILRDGDVFGEAEIVGDMPALASCIAEIGSVLLFCPASEMRQFVDHPGFLRAVVVMNYERWNRENRRRLAQQFQSVDRRLIATLLELSNSDGMITRNQAFLAETVGCSRQTINKVLSYLRTRRLVAVSKGLVRITDVQGLEAELERAGDLN